MRNSVSRLRHFIIAVLLVLINVQPSLSNDWLFEDAMEDIIDQVNDGSGQALTDAIDINALLARVFENLEVSDRLKAGFSRTIRASNNLGKNVVRAMPEGSYAKVVLVDQDGETATALVRYDFGGRGYGYHRYDLVKDESGSVRIIDWMDYLDGFRYSDALKLSAVTNGSTANSVRGLVPEHQGSDEDFA